MPFRPGLNEAPRHDAEDILRTLKHASEEGAHHARRMGGEPLAVIEAWLARDRGEDPEVVPDDALDRMRHAFSNLPNDVRCELAAKAERAAWRYHCPDLEHLRILERRDAERAEREQAEEEERRRKRDEEFEARMREHDERHKRLREEAEEEARRAEQEELRRQEESETLRRESEALRPKAA